ncbi:Uncharacterized protein YpbQ, isoprenylcysteine carboxyl methyltransferase (ICMT) family [Peptoniphilus asaccharolyticus DSM 20463]|uniref:Uncharacterized protein YpbQ, isoprenylcysteine carboxyl methyltransferase (ICMT) family n=1 Tax=Peptoniphilus asaccharolyticus DSM 20463 TaxID=573058 RepID=A0A1W1VJK7_PEPAS|nr:isoprenylcysteine carboxyl methyltransferase family protein [Peptoniphilus asaccharolyticus]MBL7574415.1 isoprenylcysteine carboxyl methyltransferase family protein [Peptoniphilus asaccharolyticus]SMB93557.1 Uncharacterized protein YpbQ, isoprenylcysteine carboxyl methyltransferase (ICMT) family [Peptoniphilus asaccharolyticus DSM 20463]
MQRYAIYAIIVIVFAIRLAFLKVSKRNERAILANGGMEYGVVNTKRITILHILFYFGSLIEAIVKRVEFDKVSLVGLILVIFSMVVLYSVVNILKGIWTVKLMIAKGHKFNSHWLFDKFKHPNYFLNIIPELIGIALICHSTITSIIILPLYMVVLYIRIREENYLIETVIKPNGI